jgi:hypothetical protein
VEANDGERKAYASAADESCRLPSQARRWAHLLITQQWETQRRALPPPRDPTTGQPAPHESPFGEINISAYGPGASATRRDIWIELNDVDDRGRVVTFADFAEPGVTIARGAVLVAGDDEGNRVEARVIGKRRRRGRPTRITLQVDLMSSGSQPSGRLRAVAAGR